MDSSRDIPSVYPAACRGSSIDLREVAADDVEAAYRWGSDAEWFRYLPFEPVHTMEEEHAFIAELIRVAERRPRDEYHLAVVQRATHEMVGLVNLRITVPHLRIAELGYGIRRDLWGHGLATEAASLLVNFGFGTLGLHRITAGHHPENVASGRILDRLGMTREGHLRQNLLAHGQWRDSVIYAVLESDWHAR